MQESKHQRSDLLAGSKQQEGATEHTKASYTLTGSIRHYPFSQVYKMGKIQLADSYWGFLLHIGFFNKGAQGPKGVTLGSAVLITTPPYPHPH